MKIFARLAIYTLLFLFFKWNAYSQTIFLSLEEKQQIEQLNSKAEVCLQDNGYEKAAVHYKDIALIYKSKNLRGLAIQFFKKSAYAASKAEDNYLIHDVNQELSLLFVDLGQHENAIDPLIKACDAMAKAKAFHSQAAGLINLGRILNKILRTEEAVKNILEAEKILLPLEDNTQLLTLCYKDLIDLYGILKDNTKQKVYKDKLANLQKLVNSADIQIQEKTDTVALNQELMSVQIFNDSLKVVSDSILKASKHQLEDELRKELLNAQKTIEIRSAALKQFEIYLYVTIFISVISIIIIWLFQFGRYKKLRFVIEATNKEIEILRRELTNIKKRNPEKTENADEKFE